MARFSKLPTWWTRSEDGFSLFKGGEHAGTSIAALKCLMVISTAIDFNSRKTTLSFSGLEKLTGLSRPMVVRGVSRLEELELVRVNRNGHTNEYELTVIKDDEWWAKLPVDRVLSNLPSIPNRGAVTLTALKSYLLLVSLRPNESDELSISYDNMRDKLSVQRNSIRSALDILLNHGLIRIRRSEGSETRPNIYAIVGLGVSST